MIPIRHSLRSDFQVPFAFFKKKWPKWMEEGQETYTTDLFLFYRKNPASLKCSFHPRSLPFETWGLTLTPHHRSCPWSGNESSESKRSTQGKGGSPRSPFCGNTFHRRIEKKKRRPSQTPAETAQLAPLISQ